MFISKVEKDYLITQVEKLQMRVTKLEDTIKNMTFAGKFVEQKPKKRQGRNWTPEQRRIQSERVRNFWEAKRKEQA